MVKLNFNLAKLSIHKDLRFDKKVFTMLFERIQFLFMGIC